MFSLTTSVVAFVGILGFRVNRRCAISQAEITRSSDAIHDQGSGRMSPLALPE